MNRLTFLKSLAALALAPAALLRVLAREPVRWPCKHTGEGHIYKTETVEPVKNPFWRSQYRNDVLDAMGNNACDYTGYPAPENRFRVYDAKVPGDGE